MTASVGIRQYRRELLGRLGRAGPRDRPARPVSRLRACRSGTAIQ